MNHSLIQGDIIFMNKLYDKTEIGSSLSIILYTLQKQTIWSAQYRNIYDNISSNAKDDD